MPNIPLADFRAMWQQNRDRYREALERVGESGWLVLGKEVETFEHELAESWGFRSAVGVASGLDALEIAFRCEGMKAGDRVLTTPLSAFATTLAILRVGALPVFVDVEKNGLLDLNRARDVMTKSQIRFVVPVHLFGHAIDLRDLAELGVQAQAKVIEDCAQAIGAKSHGRAVGTASNVCATSFYPTKNLGALGDAGALLTNSDSVRDQARRLRDYGQSSKYMHDDLGMNSRLDELQAAFLRSVQLPLLNAQTARRQEIARRYLAELQNPHVVIPSPPPNSDSVWHLFPVLVDHRESFREHLNKNNVATGIHYPRLIPDQNAMRGTAFEVVGSLDNATQYANQEVSIPLHPYLTDEDVNRVIASINNFKPKS